jgi:hypothetical protein
MRNHLGATQIKLIWDQCKQENKREGRGRTKSQSKINKKTQAICFSKFSSKEHTPRWGVHIGCVSFNPFPSLKWSLRPDDCSSLIGEHWSPQGPPHKELVSLARSLQSWEWD